MVETLFSPQTGNLLPRQNSKTKSTNQLNFFAKRVIYLPNRIKNNNDVENFMIKLNDLRNYDKKKKLRGRVNYLTEFDLYIDMAEVNNGVKSDNIEKKLSRQHKQKDRFFERQSRHYNGLDEKG